MASLTMEYVQWFLIICLMIVVGFQYLMLTMLMQQYDQLNDRMLRILSDTPPDHELEAMRSWRHDPKLGRKL